MSRGGWIGLLCALALPWAASGTALAQSDDAAPEPEAVVEDIATDQAAEDAGTPLTEDELEVVVARIALYPDELVALVVAASLYPLQIVEAERFLDKLESDPELEPDADWDGSVISLLNYPDIVRMMSEDLDWTQLVGELAVNQQKDMLVAIQQLRDEAVSDGVLKSNEQTVVVNDNDNIVIQSADPEVIYVPSYPPQMLYDPTYVVPPAPIVYSDPYPSYYYPSARFWTGVATGAVFAAAVDWNNWGTWGGDIDVDVKVDGGKINIKNNDINIKGAFLHMAADAAVSAGVVIAGLLILFTGWQWIDPVVSLLIVAVIVWSTWDLLRESVIMALAAVPRGIDAAGVRAYLAEQPGVQSLHDLHIWPMSTTDTALTCHLVMPDGHPGDRFIAETCKALRERFRIAHATLQIETDADGHCHLASDDVV